MAAPRHDPDWEPDPYDASWASWDEDDPEEKVPPEDKDALSITHDLSDDELRRFLNFDVFHDPMPRFGLIPQWVQLVAFTGLMGFFLGVGMRTRPPIVGMLLLGLGLPAFFMGLFGVWTAGQRRQARALGLCHGRVVTISPRGFSVRIPGASPTWMPAIGPISLPWVGVRRITSDARDLTFWLRRSLDDPEGRARVVVPLRAFESPAAAVAFEHAARRWKAIGAGEDTGLWEEDPS